MLAVNASQAASPPAFKTHGGILPMTQDGNYPFYEYSEGDDGNGFSATSYSLEMCPGGWCIGYGYSNGGASGTFGGQYDEITGLIIGSNGLPDDVACNPDGSE